MKVSFRNSFPKDLKSIKNPKVLSRVQATKLAIEQAPSLAHINSCKKSQGSNNFYRIRIGDYRLGFSLERDTVEFVRFLGSQDIYKYFP